MTGFSFTVNGAADTGKLTWNSNGTLQKMAIVDNIPNTLDTQTCTYTYDDLGRLGGQNANGYSVDCGRHGRNRSPTIHLKHLEVGKHQLSTDLFGGHEPIHDFRGKRSIRSE